MPRIASLLVVLAVAMQRILQALLKERLKLAARYESQERPVYFLTVARQD